MWQVRKCKALEAYFFLFSALCLPIFFFHTLLSRLFLRSKSVQKCSTAQSFTFPKFTSFKLGTLVISQKLHNCGNCTNNENYWMKVHFWHKNKISGYIVLSSAVCALKISKSSLDHHWLLYHKEWYYYY